MTKKDHILRSAQVLFGREGYHATTVKQIAEMAGVGLGLVSHYFGSKEELFLQAGEFYPTPVITVDGAAEPATVHEKIVEALLHVVS